MEKLKAEKSFRIDKTNYVLEYFPGFSLRRIPPDFQAIRTGIYGGDCVEIFTPASDGGRRKEYLIFLNVRIEDKGNPNAPAAQFILSKTSPIYINPMVNVPDIRDMLIHNMQTDAEERNVAQKFFDASFGIKPAEAAEAEPAGSWAVERFAPPDIDSTDEDESVEGETDAG